MTEVAATVPAANPSPSQHHLLLPSPRAAPDPIANFSDPALAKYTVLRLFGVTANTLGSGFIFAITVVKIFIVL